MFLEIKSSGEDAVKTAGMAKKDLEYYVNLFDKAAAGFGEINSDFQSSTVRKMLSNNIACYREIIYEKEVKLHCCL